MAEIDEPKGACPECDGYLYEVDKFAGILVLACDKCGYSTLETTEYDTYEDQS